VGEPPSLSKPPKDGSGLVMAASFGEQLRGAREARGITLREISDQTRISMRYLEAIENDDYKRLPGGIFNRSFIKAYAKHIGFDEREALEGYARTARERGAAEEVATTPRQPSVYMDGSSARSPAVTLALMVAILAILSLGIYAALHWYQRRGTNETAPPSAQESAQTVVSNDTPANPTVQPVAPSGEFRVQIKAVGLPVWVEATPDDGRPVSATLQPGDTRDYAPGEQLRLRLAKINTNALEVSVNGRRAKLPYEMKATGNSVEFVLRRDGYAQYLQ
jgi:cytoskeleton protein RodZ